MNVWKGTPGNLVAISMNAQLKPINVLIIKLARTQLVAIIASATKGCMKNQMVNVLILMNVLRKVIIVHRNQPA